MRDLAVPVGEHAVLVEEYIQYVFSSLNYFQLLGQKNFVIPVSSVVLLSAVMLRSTQVLLLAQSSLKFFDQNLLSIASDHLFKKVQI